MGYSSICLPYSFFNSYSTASSGLDDYLLSDRTRAYLDTPTYFSILHTTAWVTAKTGLVAPAETVIVAATGEAPKTETMIARAKAVTNTPEVDPRAFSAQLKEDTVVDRNHNRNPSLAPHNGRRRTPMSSLTLTRDDS